MLEGWCMRWLARHAPHTWTVTGYPHILVEVLEKFAWEGVPTEIGAGGSLGNELAYGNHRSALKCGGEILKKAATDLAMARTIVFPVTQAQETTGLRISPVGVVGRKRNCG